MAKQREIYGGGRAATLLAMGAFVAFVLVYAALYVLALEHRVAKTSSGLARIDAASRVGGDSLDVTRSALLPCALDRLGDLARAAERQFQNGATGGLWDVIVATEMRTSYAAADALYACLADSIGKVRGRLEPRIAEPVEAARQDFAQGPYKLFFGPEQLICYALTLMAFVVITFRWSAMRRIDTHRLINLLGLKVEDRIRPEDTYALIDAIEALPNESTSGLTVDALRRFQTTSDMAAAERAIRNGSDDIFNRFMSSITFVRFATWAIPTIGFIGTVRGISDALARADDPSNLPSIVSFLGSAFDTTLVALLLVLPLMLLQYRFTQRLEQRVDACMSSLESEIVGRLFVPSEPARATSTK